MQAMPRSATSWERRRRCRRPAPSASAPRSSPRARWTRTAHGYAICLLGSEESIGTVFLRNVDKVNGSGIVGIFIGDRRYLGQGYGTDALNALVDLGFGELRLERIELEVFDFNQRAIRSYEKAGFQTDAVLRRSRFHRGAHHDVHVMSILRDDWLGLSRPRSWELAEA